LVNPLQQPAILVKEGLQPLAISRPAHSW
jgi:hypothetical protein